MLPQYLYDSLSKYIDIYTGKTPPNIEGMYLFSPVKLQYASDGYNGDFYDCIMKFSKQSIRNICTYDEDQVVVKTHCDSAMIVGHDNLFTFVGKVTNVMNDGRATSVMGTLISGKKTESGITDLSYAIYMLEKYDPQHILMDVGTFRIFYDGDDLVQNYRGKYLPEKTILSNNNMTLNSMIAQKEEMP